MLRPDILVIGASAGGVDALKELVSCLPEHFTGSVFIVLHIPASSPSALPAILSKCNKFRAVHPEDGDTIVEKTIYVEAPDHHLLIEQNKVLVKKGPKENRFRPSIDALFRSAAYSYGPRVIGIILSGVLDDGTSGMWTIKRLGGTTIVQDFKEAMHPEMPMNVTQFVEVDHVVPVCEMGPLVEQLQNKAVKRKKRLSKFEREKMEIEITIAKQDNAFTMGRIDKGTLTSFTCPECHGALVRLEEARIIRFRCHTGHAFTASTLLAGLTQTIEASLWSSMRAMEECILLLAKLKETFAASGEKAAAAVFKKSETAYRERARIIHDSILSQPLLSADLQYLKKIKKKNR